jgi:zinc protease
MSIESRREYLPELLPLVKEILREPRLESDELEVIRRQAISGTEARMTEPTVLAGLAVRRELSPYATDDIRYVPDLEERIERYRSVTIEHLQELHSSQLSGQNGEICIVGSFEPAEVSEILEDVFGNWKTNVSQQRIAQPAQVGVPGMKGEILTPDKANAVYYAGMQMALRDSDLEYPALVIGNYIMGGGALTSRLGDRVRQQEGLSYTVGSGVNAHPIDQRANLTIYAIMNPDKRDVLIRVVDEELQNLLTDGVTEKELEEAKQGYLQSEQLGRTQDSNIARLLASSIFANRDMNYFGTFEASVAELTTDDVNRALKKFIEPQRLVIYTAGDFSKEAVAADKI